MFAYIGYYFNVVIVKRILGRRGSGGMRLVLSGDQFADDLFLVSTNVLRSVCLKWAIAVVWLD